MLPNQKISSNNLNFQILRKVLTNLSKKEENPIRTYSRDVRIFPLLVGQTFLVHNGQKFKAIKITKTTLGCKLGEFSSTRTPHSYKHKHITKKKK